MHEHDDKDREIRDLFSAARRVDTKEAPSFEATLEAARAEAESTPTRRGRWALRPAVATALGSLAVASFAFWLALREPLPTPVDTVVVAPQPTLPAEPPVAITPAVEPPPVRKEVAATQPNAQVQDLRAPVAALPAPKPYVAPPPPPPPPLPAEITERLQALGYTEGATMGPGAVVPSETRTDAYIADLPVPGRFYQNVLTMAPGVQDADGDGNPNVHGSRTRVLGITVGKTSRGWQADTEFAEGQLNTEGYRPIEENDFLAVRENPLSTFSIDVDTASYANVRRFINQGALPPADAVRIEELLNYFSYDDPPPTDDAPFSARIEIADCPWQSGHRLARIGLKGRTVSRGEFRGSNLVFLIDVSGSMNDPAKLPLLKSALSLLVDQLDGRDHVALVVYAGASGLVLPSTPGSAQGEIQAALGQLSAGGSTNGGAGLTLAYRIARENFVEGGVNRVILATDGDFNVGVTSDSELLQLIEKDAKRGIFLTALGFGMGNYKDDTLERLADRGNGNYAYIDDLAEARRVLVEQVGGTLVTIAKDVKIQVEFNPAIVGAYRLIGYENRMLRKEDFNDDRKDAGEIGAGHSVTALYELAPPDAVDAVVPPVDALKYQAPAAATPAAEASQEILTLKLRYKAPDRDRSRLASFPVDDGGLTLDAASADFKFAAAVAAFGMILRDSAHRGTFDLDDVQALAREGLGADEGGYRSEFLSLVAKAKALR